MAPLTVLSLLFCAFISFSAFAQNLITIQQAVSMAMGRAPEIKQAEAVASAQRERTRGYWTNIGPKVSVEYNEAHYNDKISVQFSGYDILVRDNKVRTGDLVIVQPITDAFALTELAQVEDLQAQIKEKGLVISKRDLAFSVAQLYMQAQQAQMMLEIAKMAIAAAQSQENDAAVMTRVGRLNRGDLLKLKLAVSEAQANEAKALAAKEVAFATLTEVLGLANTSSFKISPFDPKAIDLSKPVPQYDAALQDALSRNAEIAQAELGKDMASFGKNVGYAKFIPTVNLFARWDKTFGAVSFGTEPNSQSYGVQVKWDLWNNGTDIFTIREVYRQMDQADAARMLAEKALRIALYQALAMLRASDKSLALATVAVDQAEEALRIENVKFKSGNSTATELVLAETARISAKGRVVAAHTEHKVNQLNLQKILGDEQPSLGEFKQ